MSAPLAVESSLGRRTVYRFSYPYTRMDMERMQALLDDATINREYAMRFIEDDAMRIIISTTEQE
jgi:hypothetical protein